MGAWLVLAPHPDDETLGMAGIIAALAAQGRPAWVAFLTDGGASHPNSPDWPRSRIAATRAREAREALRALGAPNDRSIELGWRDAAPYASDSLEFEYSCAQLQELCRREKVRAVAVTWRHEPHCDHQAAYRLADAVRRRSRGRIALFEYLVWGWKDPDLVFRARATARLAVECSNGARLGRRAILRHRTQLSPIISGAESAFRIPPEIVGLAARNPVLLFCERRRYAS
jgi:LmbE family N-acetylglucosaminyl deacetylase